MHRSSIQFRLLAALLVSLVATFAVVVVFVYFNQRANLIDEKDHSVELNAETIKASLRNLMLSGSAPILVSTMRELSTNNAYSRIMLYRPDNTPSFSDDEVLKEVNSNVNGSFPLTARLSDARSEAEKALEAPWITGVFSNAKKMKYFDEKKGEIAYFFPVERNADCLICHVDAPPVMAVAEIRSPLAAVMGKIRGAGTLLIFFFAGIVTFLVALIFFQLRAFIVRPLLRIGEAVRRASEGDFTGKIAETGRKDEIGDFTSNFNRLLLSLEESIGEVSHSAVRIDNSAKLSRTQLFEGIGKSMGEISEGMRRVDDQTAGTTIGVEQLNASLGEIVKSIDAISSSISRQASSVEEAASSIEEMVRNIEHTAEMSGKSREISDMLSRTADDGGSAVKNAVTSIREVSDYSQQILKILSLITNISKQTNLLAMNAAIEAAHAGEAGKGFAIVADEIRRLAEDTGRNAREIGDVVGSIVSRIGDSVQLSEKAGSGLETIVGSSRENARIIAELSLSMEEQKNGAHEVLNATQELVSITEEVSEAAKAQKEATGEFAAALQGIRDMAVHSRTDVASFASSLDRLANAVEAIRETVDENAELSGRLKTMVSRFHLSPARENAKTGLKLVE